MCLFKHFRDILHCHHSLEIPHLVRCLKVFMCLQQLLSSIPLGSVGVFEVCLQNSKIEEKTRQFMVPQCRHQRAACDGLCRYPQGLGVSLLCPPRLAVPSGTCPRTSLTASGPPHVSLAVEITQSSLRRKVQSKGKKVCHGARCWRGIHHHRT